MKNKFRLIAVWGKQSGIDKAKAVQRLSARALLPGSSGVDLACHRLQLLDSKQHADAARHLIGHEQHGGTSGCVPSHFPPSVAMGLQWSLILEFSLSLTIVTFQKKKKLVLS